MPGEAPLVSVIMNCYNSETWLREALDSVFAQTYRNWEIVFWDNASTDGSAAIARSYGERVRYFRGNQTVPLGAARNLALRQARGEYLALLDCDDVWFPDKLAKQVAAMEGTEYALCYAGVIEIDATGRELRRVIPEYPSGEIFENLLRQFDINVPVAMIRRSVLEARGLSFDPQVTASEEYCLFMQLAADHTFCVMPEPLAHYRVHQRALTNASIARWAEEREYTLDLIRRAYPGIRERHREAFEEAYARARYYRARYYMATGARAKAIGELRRAIPAGRRYFALFLLSLFPTAVWDRVHAWRTGRSWFQAA